MIFRAVFFAFTQDKDVLISILQMILEKFQAIE
jgi:hypothetical protein